MQVDSDLEFALKLQSEEESLANDSFVAFCLQKEYDEESKNSRSSGGTEEASGTTYRSGILPRRSSLQSRHRPRRTDRFMSIRINRDPIMTPLLDSIRIGIGLSGGYNDDDEHEGNDNDESFTTDYDTLWNLADIVGEARPRGLNRGQINSLPTCIFNGNTAPRHHHDNDIGNSVNDANRHCEKEQDEGNSCLICLSIYEDDDILRTLPCLHRYHKTCIDKWIQSNAVCPVCRVAIRDQLRNLSD